jgi:MFS family permease
VTTRHDPYAALRSSRFARYWCSHFLDILGTQMATTALGWELYERTSSPFTLGMIGLMQVLPIILFSLFIGHIVDSRPRKGLLLLAETLMMGGILGVFATSWFNASVVLVYPFVFCMGLGTAISMTGRAVFFPQLIPKSDLHNAITWSNNSRQIATMLGPVVGGITIALSGTARWAYLAHALCCLIYIALIGSIRVQEIVKPKEKFSFHALLTGVRFIFRKRLILSTITLDLVAVLFGGATALLPMFAKDILLIGPVGLGWLRTASAFGSISMSMIIAHRPPMKHAGITMLSAVAGYGACMLIFGLSRDPVLSFIALCVGGGFDAVSVIVRHTLLQMLTPPVMLGRVYAINAVFGISSNELGNFESGVTAQFFGPVASVAAGGIISILSVLAAMAMWPEIAKLKSLAMLVPDEEDPPRAAV